MNGHAQAVGGRILTRPFRFLSVFFAIAGVLILYRLATGLGQVTAMNSTTCCCLASSPGAFLRALARSLPSWATS